MKATWCRDNEYSELCKSAEWQREDDLAAARGIVHGLLLMGGVMVMVFAAWACVRFSRFFN